MELVIDANIVFSAVISSKGRTCDLLFSDEIKLFAPEFLLEEIGKYKREILTKSKLSGVELDLALALVSSRIKFVPFSEFKRFIPKAKEVCPDPKDTEYFALALKFGCSIWSDDKELREQDSVRVISTSELLKLFEG